MHVSHRFILSTLGLVLACDAQTTDMRSALTDGLAEAEITLAEAIEIARDELPGALLAEAELEVEDGETYYEVELVAEGIEHEFEIDHVGGTILEREQEDEADDPGIELPSGVSWQALLETAEAEVDGIAFEVEGDAETGHVEVELLAGDIIWEVEMTTEGTLVEVEQDDDWEHEEEHDEGHEHDDGDGEHEDEHEDDHEESGMD